MLTWMFTFNTYIHMSELYTGNKCTPYTHQIDYPCLPVLWNNIYSNASFHLHVLSPNFTLLRENLHNYWIHFVFIKCWLFISKTVVCMHAHSLHHLSTVHVYFWITLLVANFVWYNPYPHHIPFIISTEWQTLWSRV